MDETAPFQLDELVKRSTFFSLLKYLAQLNLTSPSFHVGYISLIQTQVMQHVSKWKEMRHHECYTRGFNSGTLDEIK